MWSTRLNNTEKVEFSRKTEFSRNPKKCFFFRKITTDFENRLTHQVNIIFFFFFFFFYLFGLRPTSLYPTEQCQSILQPTISIHFAHFRLRRENSSPSDTAFVRAILFSEMLPKTISDDHKSLKMSMPCDR